MKFRVHAKSTDYFYLDVEAKNEEEAINIATETNPSEFIESDKVGSFDIERAEMLYDKLEMNKNEFNTLETCINYINSVANTLTKESNEEVSMDGNKMMACKNEIMKILSKYVELEQEKGEQENV